MFWAQAIRGFAILLCIVPSVGMALNGVPPHELRYASGLFNLMRNLGGAFGIAIATTLLQDYGRIHGQAFGEALSHGNQSLMGGMVSRLMAHGADAAHAQLIMAGEITQFVTRQALSQAFQDVFFLLAALFVLALAIVPFAKALPVGENAPPPDAH
jgi:DHA2 family multidrug resistance protein